jgi:hypothetical protein
MCFMWSALVVLAGVRPGAAQENEAAIDARFQSNCRLAAQVLSSGHPHPHAEWARAYIPDCPEEAPAFFSGRWASAPADTAALRELVSGSMRVRDARVYASVLRVVADRSRPDAVRVAAMIALARFADPRISIDIGELRVPDDPFGPVRYHGGSAVHVVHVPGTHPLGNVSGEVYATLDAISRDRTGELPAVWYAAAVLARRVGFRVTPP